MAASTGPTAPNDPLLRWSARGGELSAVATGAWTSANADRLEQLTENLGREAASSVTLDVSGVEALDTFGAWLIERLVRDSAQGQRDNPG